MNTSTCICSQLIIKMSDSFKNLRNEINKKILQVFFEAIF